MVVKAIEAVGDADPGAEDEGCALLEHNVEVDGLHRGHQGIIGELPYLAHQLSVFYLQAYLGIPKGSRL